MSSLCWNKLGYGVPVYATWDGAMGGYGQIGTIMPWELYAYTGGEGSILTCYLYTPSGWKWGYLPAWDWWTGDYDPLFAMPFISDYSLTKWCNTHNTNHNLAFNVRRQCRIFKNTTIVNYIYPGDCIFTDGKSDGGATHPYRLSITGYIKNGIHYSDSNLWCDTDIEIGYSMYSNTTIYSPNW